MNNGISVENEKSLSNISIKEICYLAIKRVFDIFVSIIGLIILIPVFIVIKIAYMCTGDFTSVIFTQERIGKNGKLFKFYKFRSMVPNADEILFRTLELDEILAEEYGKNKKLKEDPRITKIGKVIRKLSIDELPQFINVFLGQMSLIGNRPYLPREKQDMGDYYEEIIKSKPGLTGYWQVNGRSDVSFEKRLKLESYYSNNYSIMLDIKIFLKTFGVLFIGRGAK